MEHRSFGFNFDAFVRSFAPALPCSWLWKHLARTPGPLDFECWLYKPSCDLLLKLRDHGADSPSFDWAWSVCFPNNR